MTMVPTSHPSHYRPYITEALATDGGYLSIGRGGFCLHFGEGAILSGYDIETIKAECIAAGLPVIDSLGVAFERAVDIAVAGPMVAVGRASDSPPWGALSHAPLHEVASAYAAAGAEVWNMPDVAVSATNSGEESR